MEQIVNRKSAPILASFNEGAASLSHNLKTTNLLEECSVEVAAGLPISLPASRFFKPSGKSPTGEDVQRDNAVVIVSQLCDLVETAAGCFAAADQHELVPPLCDWLLPILYT